MRGCFPHELDVLRQRRVHVPAQVSCATRSRQTLCWGAGWNVAREDDRRLACVFPTIDEPGRFACRRVGDAREHHALRTFDSGRITREARNVVSRFVAYTGPVVVEQAIQQAAQRAVDMRQLAAAARDVERDIGATTGGRDGQQDGPCSKQALEFGQAVVERRVVTAVRGVDDHGFRLRGRVVGIQRRFTAAVAHVEQAICDLESQPHATRRVAVTARRHAYAAHLDATLERQTLARDGVTQKAPDNVRGVNGWVADLRQQLQRARMIAVAVRKQHGIDVPDVRNIRPQPRLWPVTQV